MTIVITTIMSAALRNLGDLDSSPNQTLSGVAF